MCLFTAGLNLAPDFPRVLEKAPLLFVGTAVGRRSPHTAGASVSPPPCCACKCGLVHKQAAALGHHSAGGHASASDSGFL